MGFALVFKRLAAALACLVLLAAPSLAGARDSAWPLYSNAEFGFSARFPGAPSVSRTTETVSGVPTTQFVAKYDLGGDSGLMLGAGRFDNGLPDPAVALMAAADGFVRRQSETILSRTRIDIQGVPAEVIVTGPDKDGYAMSIVILVKDNVAYELMAIGHGAIPSEAAVFQKSFTLLDAN